MPDRVELVSRDEQEALRRLPGPAGLNTSVPGADDAAAAVLPVQAGIGRGRFRSGAFPSATGQASFIAMQRLAGNRAMLQALGRSQMSGLLETLDPDLGEETASGGVPPVEALWLPGQAGAAPGGSGGGSNAGGRAADGADGVSNPSGEPTGDRAGGSPAAGGAATAGAGVGGTGSAASGAATARESGAGGAGKTTASGAGPSRATAGTAHSRKSPPPPITAAGGGSTPSPTGGPTTGGPTTGASPAPAVGGPGPAPGADFTGASIAPAPAPGPASVSAGAGGTADANTAKTGIDWNQMLSDFGPPARTVLEIGRLVPGWGLLAGLASDSINFASDLSSIPNSENANLATGLVVFRNYVNIYNNALGHVLYVNQLIQDGLAGSVVGAEFTPLTAAANEVLSTTKVVLDEVQMGTDILVEVEAQYEANHAPGTAEAEQWRQLADNYASNILGDIVNTVLDVISLASAGAANTAPIEEAKLPLTLAGSFLKNAAPNIISAINNVLGVWLGSAVTGGRHAPAGGSGVGGGAGQPAAPGGAGASAGVQRIFGTLPGGDGERGSQAAALNDQALVLDIAGGFIDTEAPQARGMYDGINAVIGMFEAYANDQIAQIDAVVGALSGGKSAFQVIRDAVKAGLDDMNGKLAMAQQLGETATNGKANSESISAACTSVMSSLDALVMPDVQIPSVDLGDGVLADAAAAIANTAAEAANLALQAAMSGVSAALDTAKDEVRNPIQELKERADGLGEWLAILATKSTEMVGTLHEHIASFSEGLGHCTNVEQVIDMIIGQVSALTGMPTFTVQELRDTWNGVGPHIDELAALGPQLHDRAAELRAQAAQLGDGGEAGPTFALPPGPPQNPAAGAGPGVGLPA